MQKFIAQYVDTAGNAIAGGSVLVTDFLTGATSSIYADDNVTPVSNPLTTDVNGMAQFSAPDGRYNIVMSKTGQTTITTNKVLLDDNNSEWTNGDGVSHTFGQLVYISGIKTVQLATNAGTAAQARVAAICLSTSVAAGAVGQYLLKSGETVRGLSGGTAGAVAYLGAAGAIGTTGTTPVGFWRAASELVFLPQGFTAGSQVLPTVRDYGAKGDGATDDSAAFSAMNTALGFVRIPAGTFKIGTNTTLSGQAIFLPGGIVSIPTAITLTLNGGVSAAIQQIFSLAGTGLVVLAKTPTGYPEWWGAVTGGADCLAAINACIVACPETKLQAADYYVSGTVLMQTESRALRGSGWHYDAVAGLASRIMVTTATNNVLQVGPSVQPGSINLFQKGNVVENLELTRSVVPSTTSACAGLLAQFVSYLTVRGVKSAESLYGFRYAGCVSSHTIMCYAFRSTVGSGGGDFWYGYYVDGGTYNIGASGGNASIYFDECNANIGAGPTATANGFYLSSPFTDCYIRRFESTGTNVGINVQGNSSTSQNYGNIDLIITDPVIDTFLLAGIFLQNISKYGCVEINGGYAAPSGTGSPTACIYFSNSLGMVSISNFQGILTPNVNCKGIVAITAASIVTNGNMWVDATAGVIALSGVASCSFNDQSTNYNSVAAFILQATTVTRSKLNVLATGAASKISLGYQLLGTANHFNEVNCTGLDTGAIVTSSANKLVSNGVQITTTGTFGTDNIAAGVMA